MWPVRIAAGSRILYSRVTTSGRVEFVILTQPGIKHSSKEQLACNKIVFQEFSNQSLGHNHFYPTQIIPKPTSDTSQPRRRLQLFRSSFHPSFASRVILRRRYAL
jgi:hypothetical protein